MPEISEKYVPFVRAQLRRITNYSASEPITVERKAQDLVGAIMQKAAPGVKLCQESLFPGFRAAMLSPEFPLQEGVVLYLHGGGYCCGDLEYAKGFGTILSDLAGVRVFCPAYRLAPEYPFPAALDDALESYRFLLKTFPAEKIVLSGESAGGGLIYCLCLKAREEGLPLPGGLVAMSPWTDLTSSGASYSENVDVDPSMTPEKLARFAFCYTREPENPLCSPLFGDLAGLPESLIFVGGDEVMRDDAVQMHQRLLASGCKSTLTVAPEMWHAYVLYGIKERHSDVDDICAFIRRVTA